MHRILRFQRLLWTLIKIYNILSICLSSQYPILKTLWMLKTMAIGNSGLYLKTWVLKKKVIIWFSDQLLKSCINKSDCLRMFGQEKRFNYIMNGLYPPNNGGGIAFEDEWLTLLSMGDIVATCYNRVVVELANHKIRISETFFPFRGSPPLNSKTHIMCHGLLSDHFVHFF